MLGTRAFIELKSVTKNLAKSKHKILDFSANLQKLKKIVIFLLCTKFNGTQKSTKFKIFLQQLNESLNFSAAVQNLAILIASDALDHFHQSHQYELKKKKIFLILIHQG